MQREAGPSSRAKWGQIVRGGARGRRRELVHGSEHRGPPALLHNLHPPPRPGPRAPAGARGGGRPGPSARAAADRPPPRPRPRVGFPDSPHRRAPGREHRPGGPPGSPAAAGSGSRPHRAASGIRRARLRDFSPDQRPDWLLPNTASQWERESPLRHHHRANPGASEGGGATRAGAHGPVSGRSRGAREPQRGWGGQGALPGRGRGAPCRGPAEPEPQPSPCARSGPQRGSAAERVSPQAGH